MSKNKTINIPKPKGKIPNKKTNLPLSSKTEVDNLKFLYSFVSFDRNHELFNLGGVKTSWFLELLDCLKEVSSKTIPELKGGKYDLHPVDWNNSNTTQPKEHSQQEFWQFRLSKSKGRVVGYKIENVFYIVWLDVNHNLANSEGYGTIKYYDKPKTDYELLFNEHEELKFEHTSLIEIFNDCDHTKCPLLNERNKK